MYFIKALEAKNDAWRYILTLGLVCISYFVLGGIPLLLVIVGLNNGSANVDIEGFAETHNPELLGMDQNLGLFLMLIPSVLAFFTLLILMIKLHGQRLGSIASHLGKIRWNRVYTGGILWLLFLISAEIIFYLIEPTNYKFTFDTANFLPLLLICLFIIPLQAWSEELLFRSYLMQGIGLLTGVRIVALLITSIAFGLLHISNPEVENFGFLNTMPYYVGFGLFAGLLVIFDGGIELAFTVHAVNNIYSALIVNYESAVLSTSSLLKIQELNPMLMNGGFLIMSVLFILILAKRFKWNIPGNLFSQKLIGVKF